MSEQFGTDWWGDPAMGATDHDGQTQCEKSEVAGAAGYASGCVEAVDEVARMMSQLGFFAPFPDLSEQGGCYTYFNSTQDEGDARNDRRKTAISCHCGGREIEPIRP